MASDWQSFVDDVFTDLTENVPGFRGVLEHRYAPYDPEELVAEAGERHLSVFPIAEQAQTSEPLVTAPGGDRLTETYRVLYWEHSGDESTRAVADQQAAADLMDLARRTRDRFYVTLNIFAPTAFGAASSVRYLGTAFPDRSSRVRWFATGVQAIREIDAS